MRKKYFSMATDGEHLDIVIFGDITSWPGIESDVSSYNLAQLIDTSTAASIHVRINSYGGEVAEGLAIYNSLKNHPARITTECSGFACSAASIVFMAGEERYMNTASLLMIHNAWSRVRGNADQLRKEADTLDLISATAASAYKAVMTISEEELDALLKNESWISPEDAVSYGFATGILGEEERDNPSQSVRQYVYDRMITMPTLGQQDPVISPTPRAVALVHPAENDPGKNESVAPVQPPVSHVRAVFKNFYKESTNHLKKGDEK